MGSSVGTFHPDLFSLLLQPRDEWGVSVPDSVSLSTNVWTLHSPLESPSLGPGEGFGVELKDREDVKFRRPYLPCVVSRRGYPFSN